MSDARTLQNLDERTLAVHEARWRTRSFRRRSQISCYLQYYGNQNFKTYT
ncbi:hypothetical protein NIES4072_68690 [Nostoc commune NIES-4072]|uniref:Uncharacterized protein n=1 Tax=Nostoc commune NIES-4072 TaxID=2005467 RepID=A0A2R5FWP4_NOSCO|nr:hypothetical protein NIES4070_69130 [Nostoc commune HK-02]GBG23157.1 hypothetical protein NIES4072_68690 [Nostoc commune NIES-4072]